MYIHIYIYRSGILMFWRPAGNFNSSILRLDLQRERGRRVTRCVIYQYQYLNINFHIYICIYILWHLEVGPTERERTQSYGLPLKTSFTWGLSQAHTKRWVQTIRKLRRDTLITASEGIRRSSAYKGIN